MPAPPSSRGRTGRPPATSRAQILAAARELIDRDGWDRLTVRRLAAELGIGTTTLYRYVRDREDLLIQLLNTQAGRAGRPQLPTEPRKRIVAAARAMHDALADWPWAAEVLTADGFLGRLGEPALWLVETIVAGAVDSGCTPADAVGLFRSIWYYTVGEILVRANTARRSPVRDRTADSERYFRHLDPPRFPHLAAIGDRWPELSARDIYEQGVRALVDGTLGPPTTERAEPLGR